MTYVDGIAFAESRGYYVSEFVSPLKSFSVLVDGNCAIAVHPSLLLSSEKTTAIFHELGHCETGSFYNEYSSFDVRKKHEDRADKWAIKKLIQKDELDKAIQDGHREIWDLAEFFGVTEDFIRKALCLYINGNLAVEYY